MEETPEATLRLGGFDRHGTTRARYGKRWIEVEHGIPGETVRASIVGRKRLHGKILEVLDPAAERVEPPCPYFRDWDCGGCQWQQIAYEGQLRDKRVEIDDAMLAAGLDVTVSATHALRDDPWRYRSTAGIALGKRAGFRRHGSVAIVPIRDCPISHALIGRLMAILNDQLDAGSLPDFHGRVRIEARVAGSVDDPFLQVAVRPDAEAHVSEVDLEALTRALVGVDDVRSVAMVSPDGGLGSVSGELCAPVEVAGRPVTLTAISFFQTNLRLLPELITRLGEASEPLSGKRIADVYGGVGVFGLFLAAAADEVVLIERDPRAVEAAEISARQWGLENFRIVHLDAEEALAGSGPFDVVILDPPRSGLAPTVTSVLLTERPAQILYVSCLAESLARDLRALADDYEIEALELFDFYPQTYHVEILAVLRSRTR